jgi:hypothetical protein
MRLNTSCRLWSVSTLVVALIGLGSLVPADQALAVGISTAHAATVGASATSSTESWAALSADQQKILAPLSGQWATMEEASRDKWLDVANRYPTLSPDAQHKIRDRMTQWSKVPPQQRGEARLRFQNSRQLSPQERQEKWAAYQALSPEQRQDLTKQALRKQRQVALPDSVAGPRELNQINSTRTARRGGDRKANLVPGTSGLAPKSVSASVVKSGPGATTSLVTQAATPPLHQHAGLPKISASTTFVDPQTMLPRKGSQSAGMTPLNTTPASSASAP